MTHGTSGIELITREYFKYLFPNEEVIYNEKQKWLAVFNPIFKKKTNRELDIYFPRLAFGIEVHGATHFDSSVSSVDRQKKKLCQKAGVTLYEVWNVQDIVDLRQVLIERYPDITDLFVPEDLADRTRAYMHNSNNTDTPSRRAVFLKQVREKRSWEKQKYRQNLEARTEKRYHQHQRAQTRRDWDGIRAKKNRRIMHHEDLD